MPRDVRPPLLRKGGPVGRTVKKTFREIGIAVDLAVPGGVCGVFVTSWNGRRAAAVAAALTGASRRLLASRPPCRPETPPAPRRPTEASAQQRRHPVFFARPLAGAPRSPRRRQCSRGSLRGFRRSPRTVLYCVLAVCLLGAPREKPNRTAPRARRCRRIALHGVSPNRTLGPPPLLCWGRPVFNKRCTNAVLLAKKRVAPVAFGTGTGPLRPVRQPGTRSGWCCVGSGRRAMKLGGAIGNHAGPRATRVAGMKEKSPGARASPPATKALDRRSIVNVGAFPAQSLRVGSAGGTLLA